MNPESDSMGHEELSDLCAAYALGALDPIESARFEEHLRQGCPACRSEVAGYHRTVGALGTVLEAKLPPASAEARLAERLASAGGSRRQAQAVQSDHRAGSRVHWRWAAALALLVIPAAWIITDARLQVARLERELEAHETATDPIVSIFDLEAAPPAAGARARATFDPRTQTWRLFAHDLVDPPEGMTYQGWLVTVEGPLDFGAFLPDQTGHGYLALRLAGDPTTVRVGVTLEPAGGSDRPTGAPVFRHPQGETPRM